MRYSQYILNKKTDGEKEVEGKTYIYWLLDPCTQDIRYVGKTKAPRTRYHGYMSAHRTEKDVHLPVMRWIDKLRTADHYPIMHLEELVVDAVWESRERYWIAHLRSLGFKLLNIQDGGGGQTGFEVSVETKAKISAKLMGHKVSQETLALIREYGRKTTAASKYRGVSFIKKTNMWYAQIEIRGIRCHIGSFSTETEAVLARKKVEGLEPEKALKMYQANPAKMQGRRLHPSSGYPGISYSTRTNKWLAELRLHGIRCILGFHETEDEALAFQTSVKALPESDIMLRYSSAKPKRVWLPSRRAQLIAKQTTSKSDGKVPGVRFHKYAKKWQVHLNTQGSKIRLGPFDTQPEAVTAKMAYLAATPDERMAILNAAPLSQKH